MNLFLYLVLVLAQLVITGPRFRSTCNDTTGIGSLVYVLHHGLDVFVFWGFLFLTTRTEYAIHAMVLILVAIHWFTNNYECIFTTYMNEICGYPRSQWLDSIVNRIRPTYYTHTVWIVLVGIWDVFQILY
jgi:hypothetical protein